MKPSIPGPDDHSKPFGIGLMRHNLTVTVQDPIGTPARNTERTCDMIVLHLHQGKHNALLALLTPYVHNEGTVMKRPEFEDATWPERCFAKLVTPGDSALAIVFTPSEETRREIAPTSYVILQRNEAGAVVLAPASSDDLKAWRGDETNQAYAQVFHRIAVESGLLYAQREWPEHNDLWTTLDRVLGGAKTAEA